MAGERLCQAVAVFPATEKQSTVMIHLLRTKAAMLMLSIVSYNSHGLGPGKLDYIRSLCASHHLVLVQEHWQFSENLSTFQNHIPDISCHGSSAMESGHILHGRPHGGCAILWLSTMKCDVSPIETHNKRTCAVKTSPEYAY